MNWCLLAVILIVFLILVSKVCWPVDDSVTDHIFTQQIQQIQQTFDQTKTATNVCFALLGMNHCLAQLKCLKNIDGKHINRYTGLEYEIEQAYRQVTYDIQRMYPDMTITSG